MPEQVAEVLELVFGFPFGLSTKFLVHFIDIHRYDSFPVRWVDYLCFRSF